MEAINAAQRAAEHLEQPGQDYRPLPFWSWNDKLEPEELRRQIGLIKESGAGGYFMHARGGLQTEYLEQPWFESVAVGVDEGKKQKLNAWIYDEEGWPSGFSGGKVTAMGDWVYARGLRMRRLASPEEAVSGASLLGVFAVTENDAEAVPLSRIVPGKKYAGYVELTHSGCPFYVDVLNKDVIREFLNTTHEEYAKRFPLGADQGLFGFFTDEPRLSEGPVPWSYILPEEFQQRYGYSLMENLPALYLPCGGYRKVRYDFWALVSDLFVNAYMKQIGEWCTEHGCKLTGHMMMEESLYSQMTGTGGGMPFYEFMHQPGVDSLRRNISDPRIPKQVGSVAEQLGKKQVLTESFALCGWDVNFEEMRWIAGWQYVNGVNLLCQHLQAYSLRGLRKRDYPPSHFYQQSFFTEYRRFNDYISRLGQLLSEGKKCIDVLMLHPMTSGWISYDGENNEEIRALDEDFISATMTLSGLHIDYHLGDETILRRHGTLTDDGRITVGNYTYGAVVLPSCLGLDAGTLDLLGRFAAAGRPIIALGKWPSLCNGEPCPRLELLREKALFLQNPEEIKATLTPVLTAPISIKENGAEIMEIHCCQVSLPAGGRALYLVNNSKTQGYQATVSLPSALRVWQLDLDTLLQTPLALEFNGSETSFTLAVLPMQNTVLVYDDSVVQDASTMEKSGNPRVVKPGTENWTIVKTDDNLLTLDCCEYRIDSGDWQPKKAVIHLMQELLSLRHPCEIEQRFTFTLDLEPAKLHRLFFVMEQPEQFEIAVNGHPVRYEGAGWYKDISFQKINILPYLRRGTNEILLKTKFYQSPHVYDVLFGENVYETELNKLTYDMELESCYLLGDFGVYTDAKFTEGQRNSLSVSGEFVLRELPDSFVQGCFTTQGFLFFADRITVSKTVKVPEGQGPVLLDLGAPRAGLVRVAVNGTDAGAFLWSPYVKDISTLVHPGKNTVTLELFASNRNMLGPHHHTKGENYSVGPDSFTGKFSWVERESEAVVITPEMRRANYWRDDYTFVTFGLF